jgi:protein-L-isoaspartate(D-aspartate) O-methyltransferase
MGRMSSIDERAVAFRRRMVDTLVDLGVTDDAVLEAMAVVPRHRFVHRFWAVSPGRPWSPPHVREFTVGDNADDETLAVIYEATTALATRGPVDRPAATSSVSAPIIVASMLAELDLRPGARILEIGTGSGYHAALMAMLVGDPAAVTTVDIDQSLLVDTIGRLERLGYKTMTVRCADGALGAADRAPFDRIVATLGCADLSPAWMAQLATDGQLQVPLEHGHLHPRVRVRIDGGARGRFTGHSGFVRIQGRQEAEPLWPEEPSPPLGPSEPLPKGLVTALGPADPDRPTRTLGAWDFATYLALRHRGAAGLGLTRNGSVAVVRDRDLAVGGVEGPALRDTFLAIAGDWLALGAPGLSRYTMSFGARPTSEDTPADRPLGPWHVDRLWHRQTVVVEA